MKYNLFYGNSGYSGKFLEKLFDVLIDNVVKYSKKKGTIGINSSKGRNHAIIRITIMT